LERCCTTLTSEGGGPGGSGGAPPPTSLHVRCSLFCLVKSKWCRCRCEGAPCRWPGRPIKAESLIEGCSLELRGCRYLQFGPWMQKPSLNMLQSLTSSRECLKGQSGSLHSLYLAKKRQVGIRCLSNWCKKPQWLPFMHNPRSQ